MPAATGAQKEQRDAYWEELRIHLPNNVNMTADICCWWDVFQCPVIPGEANVARALDPRCNRSWNEEETRETALENRLILGHIVNEDITTR